MSNEEKFKKAGLHNRVVEPGEKFCGENTTTPQMMGVQVSVHEYAGTSFRLD